jgi:hypothetical protein
MMLFDLRHSGYGVVAAAPLDRPQDALGQHEPPGDYVPVSGVDDYVHGLIEQIAFGDGRSLSPMKSSSGTGRILPWPQCRTATE